jgi:hypothetical protein
MLGQEQLIADAPQLKALQQLLESGQEQYGSSTLSLVSISRTEAEKLVRR